MGTNAFEEASITTGSSSAEFGNAKSGIVSIVTKTGGSQYQGSLGFETDEPLGVNHGVGFNRIEGGFSGPLAGRLTFALNGTLEGRKALEDGMNSQDVPIFLQAGVDTVINQLSMCVPPSIRPLRPLNCGSCDEFQNAAADGTLTADAFGRERVGILFAWIFAAHQFGAAFAAYGAGAIRTDAGGYHWAFLLAGRHVHGRVVRGNTDPHAGSAARARLTLHVAVDLPL